MRSAPSWSLRSFCSGRRIGSSNGPVRSCRTFPPRRGRDRCRLGRVCRLGLSGRVPDPAGMHLGGSFDSASARPRRPRVCSRCSPPGPRFTAMAHSRRLRLTNAALLELQLFMAVMSIVGLAVGGAVDGHRHAEDALRRSHAELESTVDSRTRELQSALEQVSASDVRFAEAQQLAHIGSWEWNVRDNTETWSEELFRICGFEPNSFVPSFEKFLDIVHPDDREKVSRLVRDASGESSAIRIRAPHHPAGRRSAHASRSRTRRGG